MQLNLDGLQKVSDNSGEILCVKEDYRWWASHLRTIGGESKFDEYPILYYYVDQRSSNNDLYTVYANLKSFVNDGNNYSDNNFSSVCGYYKNTEVCYICNYMYNNNSRWYNKIVLKNISSDVLLTLDERTVSNSEKIQYPLCILGMQPYFGNNY